MITRDMTVMDVLNKDDKYAQVFAKYLLTCAGCPGASGETLEEAAESHGLDVEALLHDLNQA